MIRLIEKRKERLMERSFVTKTFLIIVIAVAMGCKSQKAVIDPVTQKSNTTTSKRSYSSFRPGAQCFDDSGNIINAHGGGIIYANNKYYWFGEKRGRSEQGGVNVYSSDDLYNWKFEGLALANEESLESDITRGCLMERPKVIYNEKTKKYVMWFHLELKGQGYKAARAGVAVSDNPVGPYKYLNSFRPNGNMSRDMNLYTDDDGTAYHIYSSRENYDLRITQLSDDFLTATTKDSMLFSKHREAPALFKYNNQYYLITSAATGWAPNKATMHVAASLFGPWKLSEENPMAGQGADSTFGGQSTFVFKVPGKKNAFIFIADRWNPRDLKDSRYIFLPIQFKANKPFVEWKDEWDLSFFDKPVNTSN
jgi:beta-galactosidase